jgi:NAD(P)H-hydrate epimerase
MLVRRWPAARRLCVVCGPGNNGGDGYVVAAEALRAGRELVLIEVGNPALSGPDAQACRALALAAGAQPTAALNALAAADLVVDGLFGIGLSRPPAGDFLAAIEAMNASRLPIFSLDIPSGLNGDTGHAPGAVVQATATLSFIALKQGLCTGLAADCVGALEYADLRHEAGYAIRLQGVTTVANAKPL